MSLPPAEERFYNNLLGLIELMRELSESAKDRGVAIQRVISPGEVDFLAAYLANQPKVKLIENFIRHGHTNWPRIKGREEGFFQENALSMFSNFSPKNVEAFRQLFIVKDERGEGIVTPEDREGIWDYFDALIRVSLQYIHIKRGPNGSGYSNPSAFAEVPLPEMVILYKVTLRN